MRGPPYNPELEGDLLNQIVRRESWLIKYTTFAEPRARRDEIQRFNEVELEFLHFCTSKIKECHSSQGIFL